MGATASLSTNTLSVEPGGQVTCEVRVRNTGQIVDAFTFDVLGDAGPWASVDPPLLSLFPGGEETATLTFRPPRLPTTFAGILPFGLRVNSREDPYGSVVEEGTLEVSRFTDLSAELLPRTSHGKRSARHELAIDNRSNYRVNATITAADPDDKLLFAIGPPGVVVEPGHAAFSRILVRPRKGFWRGQPKTCPYQVVVTPEEQPPFAADGTFVQEPKMPKYLIPLLIGLLALGILGTIAWFGLLKPSIKSQAKQVINDAGIPTDTTIDIAKIAADAAKADAAAAQAAAAAEEAKKASDLAAELAKKNQQLTPTVNVTEKDFGPPRDGRLVISPDPAEAPLRFFEVPDFPQEATLTISDLFFQNPNGDFGTLQLIRRLPDGTPQVMLVQRLENFRDLDFHYVSPLIFVAAQRLELAVDCDNDLQPPPKRDQPCVPSVSFSGFLAEPPPPPTP